MLHSRDLLLGVVLLAACRPRATGPAPMPETSPGTPVVEAAAVLADAGFTGDALVLRNASVEVLVEGTPDRIWPWASVTKQVIAVMIMQQVDAGTMRLEDSAALYVASLDDGQEPPTVRQLLQHRSGLRNPEDTPLNAEGIPSFYSGGPTGLSWCLEGRSLPPQEGWTYNNCDYIVLGTVLERVTGQDLAPLLRERIEQPAQLESTWLLGAGPARAPFPEDSERLRRYGASAALVGPLRDMLRFDAALLDGRLLSAESRETLWSGEPALGFMALGQWSFDARLAGCDAPIRVIERRGGIGRVQTRNFIVPDHDIAIALATEQSELEFGEIWMGTGLSHALLSAVVCEGPRG